MKLTVAELADSLEKKYAKYTPSQCVCEHDACEIMGMHEPGRCKCKNFSKGYSCPTGFLCDECGQYFPKKWLTSNHESESDEFPKTSVDIIEKE